LKALVPNGRLEDRELNKFSTLIVTFAGFYWLLRVFKNKSEEKLIIN